VALLAGGASAAEAVLLPSGRSAELFETIGDGSDDIRLRYVSEGFDPQDVDPEVLLLDMTYLCELRAATFENGNGRGRQITVSIADRPAEFGVLNTDIRQSFEAFSIDAGTCIWEAF